MPEKLPPGNVVYADFEGKKRSAELPQNQSASKPEMLENEAKEIDQDIFKNTEIEIARLQELVDKAREKFNAYEHLISSSLYNEDRYGSYVNRQRPHRLGSKTGKKKDLPRIFSVDEKGLYGKIYGYEKEFKKYIANFLLERLALENELNNTLLHLKNFKGAEGTKERLEKYLEKTTNFDFTSFAFIVIDLEGYRKKIETMEEFAKKLVN